MGPCRHPEGPPPAGSAPVCDLSDVLLIGALVNLYSYNRQTGQCETHGFNPVDVQLIEAMRHAIDMVNADHTILPNITLGYFINDTCGDVESTFRENALQFDQGACRQGIRNRRDLRRAVSVVGVVDFSKSVGTLRVAQLLDVVDIPLISATATTGILSDQRNFFRTIPSDKVAGEAVAKLVRTMNWSFIGFVFSDDVYGEGRVDAIMTELGLTSSRSCADAKQEKHGGKIENRCVAFKHRIPMTSSSQGLAFKRIWQDIARHEPQRRASVVVLVAPAGIVRSFFNYPASSGDNDLYEKALSRNTTFLGSESWGTNPYIIKDNLDLARGSISISPATDDLKSFRSHWNSLYHPRNADNPWLSDVFGCSDGDLFSCVPDRALFDEGFTMLVYVPLIYDAVLAFAHSLDAQLRKCRYEQTCFQAQAFYNLRATLESIRFTDSRNREFQFAPNGDPAVPELSIQNIRVRSQNQTEFREVGKFKFVQGRNTAQESDMAMSGAGPLRSDTNNQSDTFVLNTGLIHWNSGLPGTPISRCSITCQPGHFRLREENLSVVNEVCLSCCWSCALCSIDTYSASTDADVCLKCPPSHTSSESRERCIALSPEELAVPNPYAIASLALCIVSLAVWVLCLVQCWRKRYCFFPMSAAQTAISLAGFLLIYISMLVPIDGPANSTCITASVLSSIGMTAVASNALVYACHRLLIAYKTQFSEFLFHQDHRCFLAAIFSGVQLILFATIALVGEAPSARTEIIPHVRFSRFCGFHAVNIFTMSYVIILNFMTSLISGVCICLERRRSSPVYPLDRRSSLMILIASASSLSLLMTALPLGLQSSQSPVIKDLFLHLVPWQLATTFQLLVFCQPLRNMTPLDQQQSKWWTETITELNAMYKQTLDTQYTLAEDEDEIPRVISTGSLGTVQEGANTSQKNLLKPVTEVHIVEDLMSDGDGITEIKSTTF